MLYSREELESKNYDELVDLKNEAEEYIALLESKKAFLEEQLEKTKEDTRNLEKEIAAEKDIYTDLVEKFRMKQSNPLTRVKYPRNQPCPCGSGLKYKKCCGRFE